MVSSIVSDKPSKLPQDLLRRTEEFIWNIDSSFQHVGDERPGRESCGIREIGRDINLKTHH